MRVARDSNSEFYLNNVRVNGILPAKNIDLAFLQGCLNSSPTDFIFRLIAKSKDNNFFEANKQFIAPLPIPKASKSEVMKISDMANELQKLHTKRREKIQGIGRRLTSVPSKKQLDDFLFPELPVAKKEVLPEGETIAQLRAARKLALTARHDDLSDRLSPSAELSARLVKGEIQFLIDGVPSIAGIFPDEKDAEFLLAQWNYIASTFNVTPRTTGKALATTLQTLAQTNDKARRSQVVKMQKELEVLEKEIEQVETKLDSIVYKLYGLSKDQIAHIENVV